MVIKLTLKMIIIYNLIVDHFLFYRKDYRLYNRFKCDLRF